jgi:hypothetical protein
VIANKKVPLGEFVSVPQIPKDVQTAVLDLFASRNPSPVPEFTEATETLPGRRGNGASYLAVCSHPAAAASLNLTKAQQHEIEQMLNEVRAVYDFKVNPNDAYHLQKQRYAENRAKRKTINNQMDTASRELLDTQQKKVARQLKLQFDLEGEYYGAVLKSIGSDFSDEQRGALQQELVFVSHDAKYMAGQLKRHLLISKLEGIIGESDLRRYLGKPFEFGDGLQDGVQVVPQELLRQPTKNPRRQGR